MVNAAEKTVSAGAVSATLSWTPSAEGFFSENIRLDVSRNGAVALDQARVVRNRFFAVFDYRFTPPPLRILDLDEDRVPEVLVSVYSGGASCCFGARVYRLRSSSYTRSRLLALGSGYSLRRVGGSRTPLFVTAAQFWFSGAHACAGYPLQLIRYRRGQFGDVTDAHRRELERDARRWQHLWRSRCEGRPALDFLGAYLTDLHRLGRHRSAEQAIMEARHRGMFGNRASLGEVTEAEFRRALAQFIRRLGVGYLPDPA